MNTVTRKILLDRHISDEEYEVYLTLEPFKAEFWDSTKPPEDAYIISLELYDVVNKEWVSKRELGNWSDKNAVFTKASDKQVGRWLYEVFEVDLFINQLFTSKRTTINGRPYMYLTAASPCMRLARTEEFPGYNFLINAPE